MVLTEKNIIAMRGYYGQIPRSWIKGAAKVKLRNTIEHATDDELRMMAFGNIRTVSDEALKELSKRGVGT